MLKIEKIHTDAVIPNRAYPEDSGLDLYSTEDIVINGGETKLVPTGWKMSVPKGYEIQIRPKSGISLNTDLVIANSPGTCDSNYRDEVKVIVKNTGKDFAVVKKGKKIAQMVVSSVELWTPEKVLNLDETDRGKGGFGSTGE